MNSKDTKPSEVERIIYKLSVDISVANMAAQTATTARTVEVAQKAAKYTMQEAIDALSALILASLPGIDPNRASEFSDGERHMLNTIKSNLRDKGIRI